ncbi:uncharacterized protein M421DRAFT_91772 [Didymella exigua CBS 183.55]|uniref:Uncharacterized protein n=1 Tax=Didymella exigua CBS 183.55 TaxID=1150837 RepID=A0A6A5RQF7_9PLEO|nr:uncharacterized protein M421DRAFT_91772 [Didymella exigua CBS 183.55]KAF1929284.1 hypothetical protein M421DRAFT_91772 [Didymella exigua CBS 183.55]
MAVPQTSQTVRRWIMTAAVAGITATGTIYGAGLKTDREVRQERKRYEQASPEELISQLQIAREGLEVKKREMERKIAGFHEKKRLKEIEAQKVKDQQQQPR